MGEKLRDVLTPGLDVVFCGMAAGKASATAGAYYAGSGNQFWATLHEVGLTPQQYPPARFDRVLEHSIGLTDLCKLEAGNDDELSGESFDLDRLISQMKRFRPKVLAFNGKAAAKEAFGLRRTPQVTYGPQDRSIGGVPTFVLPSTSGSARKHWSIEPWRELTGVARGE